MAAMPFSTEEVPGTTRMQLTFRGGRGGSANNSRAVWAPMPPHAPHPRGLRNTQGNVAEWTAPRYVPYPYCQPGPGNGQSAIGDPEPAIRRAARGGSSCDVPEHCTVSARTSFLPRHGVHNVGFRLICPAKGKHATPHRVR